MVIYSEEMPAGNAKGLLRGISSSERPSRGMRGRGSEPRVLWVSGSSLVCYYDTSMTLRFDAVVYFFPMEARQYRRPAETPSKVVATQRY